MAVSAPHPAASTIEVTWKEARTWGATSRLLKRRLAWSNTAAVALGVLGAVLGTAAGAARPVTPGGLAGFLGIPATGLALASAVAIAVAAYVGRQLLAPAREANWREARLLAESLTRATWKCIMRVPPYHRADASTVLLQTTQSLRSGAGSLMRLTTQNPASAPTSRSVDEYIRDRVQKQIDYYSQRSVDAADSLRRIRLVVFMLGLVAVLFGVLGVVIASLPTWVATVTTLSAAIVALFGADRLTTLGPLYQTTGNHLTGLCALWLDGAEGRKGLTPEEVRAQEIEFVERCEQVMAQENESWRTELENLPNATASLLSSIQDGVRSTGQPAVDGPAPLEQPADVEQPRN